MEAAGVIPDGYLDVQDGRIAAVGAWPPADDAAGEVLDAKGGWLLPGFE